LATQYLDLDDAFDAYAEAIEVSVDEVEISGESEPRLERGLP